MSQLRSDGRVDYDDKLPEGDLWWHISQRRPGDRTFFKCSWMPSHLADEGNAKKRDKFIGTGVASEYDIKANDEADSIAKASLHSECTPHQFASGPSQAMPHHKWW